MSKKTVFVEIEEPMGAWSADHVMVSDHDGYGSSRQAPVIAVHRSLPAAISPEAQAVLDAAVEFENQSADSSDSVATRLAKRNLMVATRLYITSLTPPDPLDEVRAHLRDIAACAPNHSPMMGWAHAALAALDRAQKKGETA